MEELQKKNLDLKSVFQNEYILYLLRNGKEPVSVFSFCEQLEILEDSFYNYFNSFRSLEASIWEMFFEQTLDAISQDEEFEQYSAQEKILSFFYTILEVFKQNRSFVVLKLKNISRKNFRPKTLESFRKRFNLWVKEVINQGIKTEEIATRPLVVEKYNEVLWGQFLYIVRVWINDESSDFQISDAIVEKTSALLFELMKKGPVDLLIDFLKFAYQNKAY